MTVHGEIVNHFQLRARVDGEGLAFAFHLLKGSETVSRSRYGRRRDHTFGVTGAGISQIKAFRRLARRAGRVRAERSATISRVSRRARRRPRVADRNCGSEQA